MVRSKAKHALLIDAKGGDLPVSVYESARVVVDVVDTSRGTRARVRVTSPVTAEGQVDDDVVHAKVLIHVALSVGEVGDRSTLNLCVSLSTSKVCM